jgi:hypothetical protein
MSEGRRCNAIDNDTNGVHILCPNDAFASVPCVDGEGRDLAEPLRVCFAHLFVLLKLQQEARSR